MASGAATVVIIWVWLIGEVAIDALDWFICELNDLCVCSEVAREEEKEGESERENENSNGMKKKLCSLKPRMN